MSKWLDNAVFYQIYPQSFRDSNADGIGDIPGIIEKLDYVQQLGCNAIWLNPCFQSPFIDAGYDISDYYTVAPRYGTNADLRRLFREVHARGMHIILDLVPGHTSDQHEWFLESQKGTDLPCSKRYIWTNDRLQKFNLENSNIRSFIMGIGNRETPCAVNYYSCQPCLNYGFENIDADYQSGTESPEAVATREAIMDVMRFWLRMGCDGFRVDMAKSLVKQDPEGKGNVRLWRHFRDFLDAEFPDAAMISEWGDPSLSLQAGFHMDFLLHNGPSHYFDLFRGDAPCFWRDGGGDVAPFLQAYRKSYENASGKGLICIPSGNHDCARLGGKLDAEEIKIAFAFILSMPGAPFIYFGDEIGMRWIPGLPSKEGSRELRAGSRTPMQWADDVNDGFSEARPDHLYLPLDPNPDHPRVEAQMGLDGSVWEEVHKLIMLRRNTEPLQSNAAVTFLSGDDFPLVYRRDGQTGSVLVVVNPRNQQAECACDLEKLGTVIYENNGAACLEGGKLHIPAACACMFALG